MRISYKQLKKIPVETKSGVELGSVSDIVLDVDTQSIVQYVVSGSLFSTQTNVIHHDQVVSISAEKIVVKDGTIKSTESKAVKAKGSMEVEPVAMREEG